MDNLNKKYKLGIVTDTLTSGEQEVREALRKIGIERYFDVVVTSVDVGCSKPNERIFQVALKEQPNLIIHSLKELPQALLQINTE